jgi:hypothetical protein
MKRKQSGKATECQWERKYHDTHLKNIKMRRKRTYIIASGYVERFTINKVVAVRVCFDCLPFAYDTSTKRIK